MLLELDGYEASVANSGREALELFEELHPSVILLDVGLPDMSGYDVARQMRAMPGGADVTIMAVTGWGSDRDKTLAQQAGCDIHITKPVNFDRLERLLKGEGVEDGVTKLSSQEHDRGRHDPLLSPNEPELLGRGSLDRKLGRSTP
jgi:CheY-like chemotaxis protein